MSYEVDTYYYKLILHKRTLRLKEIGQLNQGHPAGIETKEIWPQSLCV